MDTVEVTTNIIEHDQPVVLWQLLHQPYQFLTLRPSVLAHSRPQFSACRVNLLAGKMTLALTVRR